MPNNTNGNKWRKEKIGEKEREKTNKPKDRLVKKAFVWGYRKFESHIKMFGADR